MPRIQTFISHEMETEINDIVKLKRSEGADRNEVNVSNTAAMLMEIGLNVYKKNTESQKKLDPVRVNEILLEHVIKISMVCQKLLGINSFNSEIKNMDKFNFQKMVSEITNDTSSVMKKLSHSDETD